MKRFLISAALAISMLGLLAACGGDSADDDSSNQGANPAASQGIDQPTTGGGTPKETDATGASDIVVLSGNDAITDPDAEVQTYLDLMDQLATALRAHDATDLSDEGLQPIRLLTSRLETFSPFFSGLDEEGQNYLFTKYGVELRQSAERVATYAVTVQERRGDNAISQELASLPAFAITTTNTASGAGTRSGSTTTTTEPVQAPYGVISTLLTGDDVSGLAGGVGLSTEQIDLKSRAAAVDPSQVENMVSFDSLSFDTADASQGLTLTAIEFDSEEAAVDQMTLMTSEGPELQPLADPIGDESGVVEVNQGGFGSLLIFKKGVWVIQLHTTQPDGVTPLLDAAGVESAARIVAEKL